MNYSNNNNEQQQRDENQNNTTNHSSGNNNTTKQPSLKDKLKNFITESEKKPIDEACEEFAQFVKIGKIEAKIYVISDIINDLHYQLDNYSAFENQGKAVQMVINREKKRLDALKNELKYERGKISFNFKQEFGNNNNIKQPVQNEEMNYNHH